MWGGKGDEVSGDVDLVIAEVLVRADEPPLPMRHFDSALAGMCPTTLDWLASARSYVEFANSGGQFDDVATFLRSREVRGWKV